VTAGPAGAVAMVVALLLPVLLLGLVLELDRYEDTLFPQQAPRPHTPRPGRRSGGRHARRGRAREQRPKAGPPQSPGPSSRRAAPARTAPPVGEAVTR
jgi:hypothetical protein